ncbi:MAG: DUF2059 domain-containing protein [Aureliella sp.]
MRFQLVSLAFVSITSLAQADHCLAQSQAAVHQRLGNITTESLRPDKILGTLLRDPRIDPSVRQDLSSDSALLLGTNWESAEKKIAELYRANFSEAELGELNRFFASEVGKKLLAKHSQFASELLLHAMLSEKEKKARQVLGPAFNQVLEDAIPTAKAKVAEALKASPPSRDLLLGTWYTKDLMDPDIVFYGKQSRSEDGTGLSAGVFIDHAEKTYDEFVDPGIWEMRGQVVIELSFNDLSTPSVWVIEKVDEENLRWTLFDPTLDPAEWLVSKEGRTAIAPPSRPAGYKAPEY